MVRHPERSEGVPLLFNSKCAILRGGMPIKRPSGAPTILGWYPEFQFCGESRHTNFPE